MARKYPHRRPAEILSDLVCLTPGDEPKWFAAAKEAGFYNEALASGYGYEISTADVWTAFTNTIHAAQRNGTAEGTLIRLRPLVAGDSSIGQIVTRTLHSTLWPTGRP